MDFARDYPSVDTFVYRAIEKSKADRTRTPIGPSIKAFYRKQKEEFDGPSLFFSPDMCFTLDVVTVAKLRVGDINSVANGGNGQPLTVVQDKPEHCYIANVPKFGSDKKSIDDAATDLFAICERLADEELERAKIEGDLIKQQRLVTTE